MIKHDTVSDLLSAGHTNDPAIKALDRGALSFGALRELVMRTGELLNSAGIGRNDRVAIVLPNGAEIATTLLAVSCAATAAPLNPSFKSTEFDFYLNDLGTKALIVQAGQDSAARAVAITRGIQVFELVPLTGAAGDFTLTTTSYRRRKERLEFDGPKSDDVALVLHTSGTTARPKIVPLTHSNLSASALNIVKTLALGPSDVCLNIMPLFHIHGIVAALLSSLAAGGTLVCTPGLNAFRFFPWLKQVRPTWYTAVPTMHQTLLDLAPRFKEALLDGRLRFIRSSSASLPAPTMAALEKTFDVPVIEAYGMTEAAHQMASNPLPPLPRYAGSVGIAAGAEIAIMDEQGKLLPESAAGEVVIRGPTVTAGYENNPQTNAVSFANGWFRTGDQGVINRAGYLRLTGRLKELINRGGEKVSPLEVDNVLMEHPSVRQAVTFAVSSRLFGEDVAAAVVLQDDMPVDGEELRRFVAERLAAFKVPKQIVILNEIPKGPTGKVQRVGLAARLGIVD